MASPMKKMLSQLVSPKNQTKEECTSDSTLNQFANDGSFFDMYRKRMEELEKSQNAKSTPAPLSTECAKEQQKETTGSSNSNTPSSSSTTSAGSLLIQGKRKLTMGKMGGASKQLQIKKKKEEKESKKKEKVEEKASGWALYMEEVKKYRETTCSEEVDRVRPLVK